MWCWFLRCGLRLRLQSKMERLLPTIMIYLLKQPAVSLRLGNFVKLGHFETIG